MHGQCPRSPTWIAPELFPLISLAFRVLHEILSGVHGAAFKRRENDCSISSCLMTSSSTDGPRFVKLSAQNQTRSIFRDCLGKDNKRSSVGRVFTLPVTVTLLLPERNPKLFSSQRLLKTMGPVSTSVSFSINYFIKFTSMKNNHSGKEK